MWFIDFSRVGFGGIWYLFGMFRIYFSGGVGKVIVLRIIKFESS